MAHLGGAVGGCANSEPNYKMNFVMKAHSSNFNRSLMLLGKGAVDG